MICHNSERQKHFKHLWWVFLINILWPFERVSTKALKSLYLSVTFYFHKRNRWYDASADQHIFAKAPAWTIRLFCLDALWEWDTYFSSTIELKWLSNNCYDSEGFISNFQSKGQEREIESLRKERDIMLADTSMEDKLRKALEERDEALKRWRDMNFHFSIYQLFITGFSVF